MILLFLSIFSHPPPRLHTWDFAHLQTLRQTLPHHPLPPSTSASLHNLYISTSSPGPIPLITNKTSIPPNATANHYVSVVPYAFPCNKYPAGCLDYSKRPPNSTNCAPSGLPWVICDNELNLQAAKLTDRPGLEKISREVTRLALGAYLFRCEKRAAAAAARLKRWFIDENTRMLPNLKFGQGVPGRIVGQHSGAIDLSVFVRGLTDAVLLLQHTPEARQVWGKKEEEGMQKWALEMGNHFVNDEETVKEAVSRNNHGVYYDGTLLSLLKLGSNGTDAISKHMLNDKCTEWVFCVKGRLKDQIDEQGAQFREIVRSGRNHYVWYTLVASAHLGTTSASMGGWDGCEVLTKASDWSLERLEELMEGGEGSWLVYAGQALRLVGRLCGEERFEKGVCSVMKRIKSKESVRMMWNEHRMGMDVWNLVYPSKGGDDKWCDVWESLERFGVPEGLVSESGADIVDARVKLGGLGVIVLVMGWVGMKGMGRKWGAIGRRVVRYGKGVVV